MDDLSTEELNKKLDPIIRQIISIQRLNYLENGEKARSIAQKVQKIIEDNLNKFT